MTEPLTKLPEASVIIKVEFCDCDPMGVVWHGNYPRYLEASRCKLLDAIQYNYIEMAESKYAWPIVDMRIKYIKSLVFNQEVKVISLLKEYENRMRIDYEIKDLQTDTLLTKATTTQFAVDMELGSTCFVCPQLLEDKLRKMK